MKRCQEKKKWTVVLSISVLSVFLLCGLLFAEECPGPPSNLPEETKYPQDWTLEWDPANPDTMDREQTVSLHVIGGVGPYKWSVMGQGFSLGTEEETGDSNTLYAEATACGTASIRVYDSQGKSTGGGVRCTFGKWIFVTAFYSQGWGQGLSCDDCPGRWGGSSSCGPETEKTIISGKGKWVLGEPYCLGGECDPCLPTCCKVNWPPDEAAYWPPCGNPQQCHGVAPCSCAIFPCDAACIYHRCMCYEWTCP